MLHVAGLAALAALWTHDDFRREFASANGPRVSGGPTQAVLPMKDLVANIAAPPWKGRPDYRFETRKLASVGGKAGVLEVSYPRGSINPGNRSAPGGGMGFTATPWALPRDRITLTYSVYFDPGFKWAKGGKLPGLYIGKCCTTGGETRNKEGATYRLMWGPDGEAYAYLYTMGVDQAPDYRHGNSALGLYLSTRTGDSMFKEKVGRMKLGAWNELTLEVRLNTFGPGGRPNADGYIALSLNGTKAEYDKMVWRARPDQSVGGIIAQTFFGGSSPEWASPVDARAYFSDFVIE